MANLNTTELKSTLRALGNRIFMIMVAADIFVFAIISMGSGRRNETASGAAYRLEQKGRWQGKLFRPLIDWLLSPVEKDHCHVCWLIENKLELWNGSSL